MCAAAHRCDHLCVLELRDAWTWDFWLADTGSQYHLFFLRASRALHDPDRRHRRASVGHAVSSDLTTWTLVPDAIVPADAPRWDDLAIWTGSVVRDDAGTWRMFYTALSRADDGTVQRIGMATSSDLISWTTADAPLVVADPRWYVSGDAAEAVVPWRDPWVWRDPDAGGWSMLITAQSVESEAPADDRGVLAYASSTDLTHWHVGPPATRPGSGFSQLEVPQTAVVDDRVVLVFSCLGDDRAAPGRVPGSGGSWVVAAESLRGPFDITAAHRLVDERFYSARLVRDRAGQWQALAFQHTGEDGRFVGGLSDPMPVTWVSSAQLSLRRPPG